MTKRKKDKQPNRQKDTQTVRHTHSKILSTQAHRPRRHIDIQSLEHRYKQTYKQKDEHTDRQIDKFY